MLIYWYIKARNLGYSCQLWTISFTRLCVCLSLLKCHQEKRQCLWNNFVHYKLKPCLFTHLSPNGQCLLFTAGITLCTFIVYLYRWRAQCIIQLDSVWYCLVDMLVVDHWVCTTRQCILSVEDMLVVDGWVCTTRQCVILSRRHACCWWLSVYS